MTALLGRVTINGPETSQDSSTPSNPNLKATDGAMNGPESQQKAYDPSMLFLLEMATSLAIRDAISMRNLSAKVAGYCTEILRQRKHLHPIFVERTLIYLLALKNRGHETVKPRVYSLTKCRDWTQELVLQRSFDLFSLLSHRFSKVSQFHSHDLSSRLPKSISRLS